MTESDALSTMCSVEEAASYDDVVRAFGQLAAELHPSERCVGGTAEANQARMAEYRRRHAAVWPEMLSALKQAGCSNYSIFLRGTDLIGYLEVGDFKRFRASMAANPANERWQSDMSGLIDPLPDQATGFHQRLEEIFHLD